MTSNSSKKFPGNPELLANFSIFHIIKKMHFLNSILFSNIWSNFVTDYVKWFPWNKNDVMNIKVFHENYDEGSFKLFLQGFWGDIVQRNGINDHILWSHYGRKIEERNDGWQMVGFKAFNQSYVKVFFQINHISLPVTRGNSNIWTHIFWPAMWFIMPRETRTTQEVIEDRSEWTNFSQHFF